jgi:hypothetical protein
VTTHVPDGVDDVLIRVAADVAPAAAVEPKVRAATWGASASALVLPAVLWALGVYVFDGEVPLPLQSIIGVLVSGACTFAAGYYARHVDREA